MIERYTLWLRDATTDETLARASAKLITEIEETRLVIQNLTTELALKEQRLACILRERALRLKPGPAGRGGLT